MHHRTLANRVVKEVPLLEDPSDDAIDFIGLTADIVSAYVSHNPVPAGELPSLIDAVRSALVGLDAPGPEKIDVPVPAVPVKKSITPDHLISLEDGKPYKTLRAHLARLGLTPGAYRAKWGLRSDYPMVAPNYSKARSELARRIGLGSKPASSDAEPSPKRGRGRPKKAS